jgi:hypothetical protein
MVIANVKQYSSFLHDKNKIKVLQLISSSMDYSMNMLPNDSLQLLLLLFLMLFVKMQYNH